MASQLDRLCARLRARQTPVRAPRYTAKGTVALISDLHVPYLSPERFTQLIEALDRGRVRELALVGDLFDQEAFSTHPPGLTSPKADFSEELALGGQVLLALFEKVDRIYLLPGNHDVRILRTLKYHLGMWDLMRMVLPEASLGPNGVGRFNLRGRRKMLVVSQLPRFELVIAGELWVLLHPKAYSKVRGRIATQFADLEAAHVAVGHVHHLHQGKSSNGRWWALELGGLFDPRLLSYVHEQPMPGTNSTTGFALVGPGGPRLVYGER